MASTNGRKRRPLPLSLLQGLESLGFVETTKAPDEPQRFSLPRIPSFSLEVVASNIPGDTAVMSRWLGRAPRRLEADALLADITVDIAVADSSPGTHDSGITEEDAHEWASESGGR